MTVTELQDLRNELQRAIYSGALEIRFGDRWIRYQHTADMRQALADLNDQINTATNIAGSTRSMSNFGRFNG